MDLRPPGETDSQPPVGHLVPVSGSFLPQTAWWTPQLGQPDLITGQELGAPPSHSVHSVLTHQGQALPVGERENAPSSPLSGPGGHSLSGGRRRLLALGTGALRGLEHAGACGEGQQHRGGVRPTVSPTRQTTPTTTAIATPRPVYAPGSAFSTSLQEGHQAHDRHGEHRRHHDHPHGTTASGHDRCRRRTGHNQDADQRDHYRPCYRGRRRRSRNHQVGGAFAQLEHTVSQAHQSPLPQPDLPAYTQPQAQVPVAVGAIGRSAVLGQDPATVRPQTQMTA